MIKFYLNLIFNSIDDLNFHLILKDQNIYLNLEILKFLEYFPLYKKNIKLN